ncbi:putative transcriptional activator [Streptomyces sp. NBRC 110611]|uniref:hypothetical protein n=1 Tax=Streptomyces sp. NBRC 110611 TaxID=1621259 RepID=UPI000832E4AE|nr:hypothetical protein [Streptomyces sp. NBRC 110611]GAU67635.1 putative transcriptional activator [Streptomyces sp. NBRC 110611]
MRLAELVEDAPLWALILGLVILVPAVAWWAKVITAVGSLGRVVLGMAKLRTQAWLRRSLQSLMRDPDNSSTD